MKCQKCGYEITEGSRFCEGCGSPVDAAANGAFKCKSCGEELEEGAKFCEHCGSPAREEIEVSQETDAEPKEAVQEINGSDIKEDDKEEVGENRCPNCNEPVTLDSKFCENCGTAVGGQEIETAQPSEPAGFSQSQQPVSFGGEAAYVGANEVKKSKKGIITTVLILVFLLVAGGVGIGLYFWLKPDAIVGTWQLERAGGIGVEELIREDEEMPYIVIFNKDGSCVFEVSDSITRDDARGSWEKGNDKNVVKVTLEDIGSFNVRILDNNKIELDLYKTYSFRRISDKGLQGFRSDLNARTTERTTEATTQYTTTRETTQETVVPNVSTVQGIPADSLEGLVLQGNQRYYTDADLAGKSKYELMILRNGLFALSGRRFTKNQQVISFFNGCSWYNPDTTSDDVVKARFNEYQRANLEKIKTYE